MGIVSLLKMRMTGFGRPKTSTPQQKASVWLRALPVILMGAAVLLMYVPQAVNYYMTHWNTIDNNPVFVTVVNYCQLMLIPSLEITFGISIYVLTHGITTHARPLSALVCAAVSLALLALPLGIGVV